MVRRFKSARLLAIAQTPLSDGRGLIRTKCASDIGRSSLLAFVLCLAMHLGWVAVGSSQNRTLYVVCSEGMSLNGKDVKDVFTGKKTFSGTTLLVPVGNATGVQEFLDKIVGMSATQFEALWSKKAFQDGVNPPKLLMSDLAVINFVKRTPGAVGYVSTPPAGVTIVQMY